MPSQSEPELSDDAVSTTSFSVMYKSFRNAALSSALGSIKPIGASDARQGENSKGNKEGMRDFEKREAASTQYFFS